MITFDEADWGRQYGKFKDSIDNYVKTVGRDSLGVLKQQSVLLCTDLAFVTQPYSNSSKSKDAGEKAVERDIKRVYKGSREAYKTLKKINPLRAKSFWTLYHSADDREYKASSKFFEDVTGYAVRPFSESIHKGARNKRGRVTKTDGYIKGIYQLGEDDKVKDYVEKIKNRVGLAKSGWIAAAVQIATVKKKVPAWITRHSAMNTGSAQLIDNKGSKFYIITNKIRYINEIFNKASFLKASNLRIRSMQREVQKIMEYRGKALQ